MIGAIKSFLLVILTALNVFTSPIFGDYMAKTEPVDPDSCKLNFAAISDIHMTDEALRSMMLEFGLNDMQNSKGRYDALVCVGDLTDHGEVQEWENLAKTFAKYDPANNIILSQGNHDTWTEDDKYDLARKYFIEYNNKISGIHLKNGCPFFNKRSYSCITATRNRLR
jgi:predicted MPP superfamily phosphohydrolase